MAQVKSKRFRNRAGIRSSTPAPVDGTLPITEDMVVRSIFHDGVLPEREAGSIYVLNEAPVAIAHQSRDWEKGAAVHAAARPDPSSGAAWHGAPWDWTINGELVTDYRFVNLWHELIPYAATGLPAGARAQYRDVNLWTIEAASTAQTWDKKLGQGAPAGYQTSSGSPGGGYFRTTPTYVINTSASGAQTKLGGWPESPEAKMRTEPANQGGGWSISLDPMRTSGGALIDDMGVLHGPFSNTDSPDRIQVPDGGYVCYSGEIRLIMDDYSPVPSSAKYMACIGSDIFRAKTAAEDPPSARSTSMCNPRHIILPTDGSWVWSGYCSGSADMIRNTFPTLPFVNA